MSSRRHAGLARLALAVILGSVALSVFRSDNPFAFLFVGGTSALGALAVLGRGPLGLSLTSAAGLTMLGWIVFQFATLGIVSVHQPVIAILGTVVLALSGYLRDREPALA